MTLIYMFATVAHEMGGQLYLSMDSHSHRNRSHRSLPNWKPLDIELWPMVDVALVNPIDLHQGLTTIHWLQT